MKKKAVQIWVDPDFKRDIKLFAAKKNCSIMEATKEITRKIKEEDSDESFSILRPKYKI